MTKARRISSLVLVLTAGASLAACSSHPGSAAVVDGRSISPTAVREVQTEVGDYLQDKSTPAILTMLVQEQAVIDFAASHGVGASEEDGDKLLESVSSQSGVKDAHFSDASRGVAQFSVAYSNIAALQDDDVMTQLTDTLKGLHVAVNPRFGSGSTAERVSAPVPWPWISAAR
ncbi:hypothetical protein [Cellulomonas edaphi]|uniref:Lipoprotein n=1 Tax=Cellulomonas edaphi TaxID=3053468 RepID=A0ABT7S504_9CELL|nr:hypothetical protein [Cellulomons edaphi]MDM7830701.1 hypothetical protein [Cellulomons edaphi]